MTLDTFSQPSQANFAFETCFLQGQWTLWSDPWGGRCGWELLQVQRRLRGKL